MGFTAEEIREFTSEVEELLDGAERCLLDLDRGAPMSAHYDEIFRDFHSIKGAAGMMEMTALQSHMHQAENAFSELKTSKTISKSKIGVFLRDIDVARQLLRGKAVQRPLEAPEPAPAPVPVAAVAADSPGPQSKPPPVARVIVVDDEPEILAIESDILTDANCEVTTSGDPTQVEGLVAAIKPDVVITDIAMPRMNGVQLLTVLARRWPDLPVIFVSGHVDKKVLIEAISTGVYAVLEKPFRPHRLLEVCLNAARRHQLTRLLERTVNLLMYQYTDLQEYLLQKGREDVSKVIRRELDALLDQRRSLRLWAAHAAAAGDKVQKG